MTTGTVHDDTFKIHERTDHSGTGHMNLLVQHFGAEHSEIGTVTTADGVVESPQMSSPVNMQDRQPAAPQ